MPSRGTTPNPSLARFLENTCTSGASSASSVPSQVPHVAPSETPLTSTTSCGCVAPASTQRQDFPTPRRLHFVDQVSHREASRRPCVDLAPFPSKFHVEPSRVISRARACIRSPWPPDLSASRGAHHTEAQRVFAPLRLRSPTQGSCQHPIHGRLGPHAMDRVHRRLTEGTAVRISSEGGCIQHCRRSLTHVAPGEHPTGFNPAPGAVVQASPGPSHSSHRAPVTPLLNSPLG